VITHRTFRSSFVVTLAAAAPMTACSITCPSEIQNDSPCHFWNVGTCQERTGCGPNGFRCENGKWHQSMTFCNPPRLPQAPQIPSLPTPTVPTQIFMDAGPCTSVTEGAACTTEALTCIERLGCGREGFRCENGAWRAIFRHCNPPRS